MLRRPELPKIARIDMTPMAGVLICLLIIFFVLTPPGCGVCVELPTVSAISLTEAPANEQTIRIGITDQGRIYFNGKRLENGFEELAEALRDAVEKSPDGLGTVLIKADVTVPFADVRAIAEACRRAGVTWAQLIAEPRLDEAEVAEALRVLTSLPRL